MKTFKDFFQESVMRLDETSLSRLFKHVEDNRPIAMLSGHRYQDEDGNVMSKGQNRARNKEIEQILRGQNFGYTKVKGAYVETTKEGKKVEVTEDSFIIFGEIGADQKLKGVATKIGKKYNQESVFFRDGKGQAQLIATRGDTWMGAVGSVVGLGRFAPTKLGEYYTKLKGNRKFTFTSITEGFEPTDGMGFFGKWTVDVIRQQYIDED